ncbi:acyl-CoA thioesterase [Rhodococcus sp. ZPP]|uniref:acyl-CoA thioesterase n=1 Tax=Rhodococcus sp. ZPP TaxID=2749906 RepID=UPI001AD86EE6|nr:acyl-CoA thioesterase [Rhodococcus sp. ZPP]QTJ67937.1 acyl-CoA thioesterase [Rhodococcus sp. ZPP]
MRYKPEGAVEVELRWTDIDAYRHVSHMALVTIVDQGRGRWLDSLGELPDDWSYVVARLELDFRSPAVLDDRKLLCSFAVDHVGTSSIRLHEQVTTPTGTVVLEAVSVIVAWNTDLSRSRALTEEEKSLLSSIPDHWRG